MSYVAVSEITRGWIFLNIWHNLQYLLFVWARNARRFERVDGPERGPMAWVSRPHNWMAYALVCVLSSTGAYVLLGAALDGLAAWGIGAVLVVHQAVNFHHYIVDAVIWRRGGSG